MLKKILKKKSNLVKIANQIILRFATLFFGLLISRVLISNLPTEVYVKYSLFTDSINNLVLLIISLSIPQIIQKYFTNYTLESEIMKSGKLWTTMWAVRMGSYFFGLVVACLIFFTVQITNSNFPFNLANISTLVGLYTVQYLLVVDNSFRGIYDATGRGWIFNFTDAISKGCLAILLFSLSLVVKSDDFINTFIAVGLLAYTLSNLMDYYFNRHYIRWGKIDWNIIFENRSLIFNVSLSSIFIYFYTFSFQYIFTLNSIDSYQIANFSNAYNRVFISLLSVLSFVFSQYSTKLKVAYDQKNTVAIASIWRLVIIFSIGYFLFAQLAGRLVLYFLDSKNLYPDSVGLFQILCFGLLFYPVNIMLTNFFIFVNKDKYEFVNSLVLAILGSIAIFTMSKFYGVAGAAIALVGLAFVEFLIRLYLYFKIKKFLL